ncbi:MAG TPA: transcription antitermination factor NusB [Candidatus Pullichristensenella stercorigallinarum]|uniref:Transcription antitermination protein NusB n=1 Tax=Candidatus Pullichristensenella stercorigallinarum TaxID=2840909 RepID=A0A9D0ZNS3_9FIRM|nr:transcription antitermination factor NusB [Candidatus Pullichristensenella stercorigallinarum]
MNRVTARTHAMKLIYEWEMGGEGGEETRLNLLGAQPGEEEYAFMERMFQGVVENVAALDESIEKNARGWKLERISKVDLAILRLAAYEMSLGKTNENIVISEAVEMARQYSGEKSPQFVHGVLGGISRSAAQ